MSSAVQWERALPKGAAIALASALWPSEATTFTSKKVACERLADEKLVIIEEGLRWVEKGHWSS